MSDEHDHPHHDHEHPHEHPAPVAPEPAPVEDPGSEALAEALKSSFGLVQIVMVILVIIFVFSGFFKVQEGQKAVILRFGNPVGVGNAALLGPGLHFAFPYPIDEVVKIPYAQLRTAKSTVGWYNITPTQEVLGIEPQAGPGFNPAVDGYAVTGDGNIIHTRATLTYRIDDPLRYEFEFTHASNAVQDALDNALLYAASRFTVDDVLTREITRFQDTVKARVTDLVRNEKLGVVIENCQVESRPPLYLKDAFTAVLTALSTRDKNHNDALSYQNQVLSKAAAEAASRTNSAQAERVRLVESVKAEAQRFSDLLPSYQTNPALFANVFLIESLGHVLTNVQDKIYLPERADGKTRQLRLELSREPRKPAAAGP